MTRDLCFRPATLAEKEGETGFAPAQIRCALKTVDSPQPKLIGHVRYINILTWLRGFQVKLLYLVLFSLYLSLLWELRDKRNLKNLQF